MPCHAMCAVVPCHAMPACHHACRSCAPCPRWPRCAMAAAPPLHHCWPPAANSAAPFLHMPRSALNDLAKGTLWRLLGEEYPEEGATTAKALAAVPKQASVRWAGQARGGSWVVACRQAGRRRAGGGVRIGRTARFLCSLAPLPAALGAALFSSCRAAGTSRAAWPAAGLRARTAVSAL